MLIDKALTWTSFDVVNKMRMSLRKALGIKKIKVGHAGTLDPLATGLVIVCTGRATKRISEFQDLDKTYTAQIRLGASTPSYDLETNIDRECPWEHINREALDRVLKGFVGETEQLPPVFSAKSVDGKRAYNMARKGKEIALRPQLVRIDKLSVLSFEGRDLVLEVSCGKGTYIRSLAHDIGEALDSCAHLQGLRRTRIGPYKVENALNLEQFSEKLKLL